MRGLLQDVGYGLLLPVLLLIALTPVLWGFISAIRDGYEGAAGGWALFLIPALILLPFGFWGAFQDARRRRKLLEQEFRE